MKAFVKSAISDEKGGALVLVLILLLVGGLISAGLLGHMGAGLLSGEVYDRRTAELYAADAGVEDALWQIQKEKLADLFSESQSEYDEYDYFTSWDYDLNNHQGNHQGGVAEIVLVNDKDVNVTIENVWIPMGVPVPDANTARQIIEEGKLIIAGSPALVGTSQYELKISYDPCGGIPAVKTIGIWLPAGFEYDNNCSLEGEDYYSEPTVTPHKGGDAVVWSFSPPVSLAEFPDSFTFQYSGPEGQIPGAALSWIDTTWVDTIPGYTWDADVKIYKVVSTATDPNTESQTTVEGYSSKVEMRKLGAAISGDYRAIGATLMTATDTDYPRYRNTLFKESSATVQSGNPLAPGYIPADAVIEAAWLYWSGWIDGTSVPFSESCVEDARVNRVLFNDVEITADPDYCQAMQTEDSGAQNSWSYSCFYDATDLELNEGSSVEALIEEEMHSGGSGSLEFSLGHMLEGNGYTLYDPVSGSPSGTTGYPLATPAVKAGQGNYANQYQWTYAGWSLLIIYSSPETKGHQLYLFDTFRYVGTADIPVEFTISGFLAPDDTTGSHLTYFVGEGDDHYSGDYIKVNGYKLPQPGDPYEPYSGFNPQNNVFNSKSNSIDEATYKSGIDVDTFDMSDCIDPGDTSADVILDHGEEIYNLVYIILSFRSETTSGGIMGYIIR